MYRFLSLFLCLSVLSACTAMKPATTQRAVCNKLKGDIVFSGATSDPRAAEIQSAEEPLQQYTYDQNDCDNA